MSQSIKREVFNLTESQFFCEQSRRDNDELKGQRQNVWVLFKITTCLFAN